MRRIRRLALAFAVLAACAAGLVPGSARAADDPEALVRQGIELRRLGDHEGALKLFQRAYDQSQSPRALAQVGLAEQALGRWAAAEKHVNEALVLFSSDPWIKKNAHVLETALDFIHEHVGSVEIVVTAADGSRPEADLTVDGQAVDRALWASKALRLSQGNATLRIEAHGYRGESRTVAVVAQRTSREQFTLKPAGGAAVTAAAPATTTTTTATGRDGTTPAATDTTATPATAVAVAATPPASSSDGSGRRLAGLVVGGVGVAALAAGVYFALQVKSASDDVTKSPVFPQDAQDRGLRAQTLELVSLGVGAAAIATGLVLYLWAPSHAGTEQQHASRSPRLAPVLAPGYAGGALTVPLPL